MDINVDTNVSYSVKTVKISSLIFNMSNVAGKEALTTIVPYQWIDENKKVVRVGNNIYPEIQLDTFFASQGNDFAPISSALKSLFFVKGITPSLVIRLNNDGSMDGLAGAVVASNGVTKWVSARVTTNQVGSALMANNVSVSNVQSMISLFTVSAVNNS